MTLETTPPLIDYVENGATLIHAIPFQFDTAAEIVCTRIPAGGVEGAPLVLGTDYNIAGGAGATGTLTKTSGGTAGTSFRIRRSTTRAQQTSFAEHSDFSTSAMDSALDRDAAVDQEQDVALSLLEARTLRTPAGELMAVLPQASQRKGTLPGFNALTGFLELLSYSALSTLIAPFLPVALKGDPGSPGEGYATRITMAARAAPALFDDVYLTEKGREGKFVVDLAANWTAAIAADTQQGLFVVSTKDATKVYVRKFTGAWDARWFSVLFDDEGGAGTDNLAAINAMLALAGLLGTSKPRAGVTTERPSVTIEFPGYFFVSDAVNLFTQVHLKGFGIGMAGGQFTRWRVPSGKAALIVNHFGTRGYTVGNDPTQVTSAQGSIVEGIFFLGGTEGVPGGGAGYDDTAHADGLLMRARAAVKDCRFEAFQRNGIAILAGSDTNPILGNANSFMIARCATYYNGSHGLHTQGTDANAGLCILLDTSFNRRWGVLEESFLGNHYVSCHAANNGITGNGTTDVDSVCAFPAAGQRYAVAFGQEVAAATTQPGTNGNVWIPINGSNGGRTWVNGLVVRSGGPYCLRSVSQNEFGYAEGGQGPDQALSPSLTFGGIKGSDGSAFFGDGIWLKGQLGNLYCSGGLETHNTISIFGAAAGLIVNSRDTGAAYQLFNSLGVLGFHNGTMRVSFDAAGNANLATGVLKIGNQQVVGGRLAGLPPNATDLATALTLVNAIRDRLKTTGGHGLVAD